MDGEIRILLIDDHTLFRESLARSLASTAHFRVVGSCASTLEALAIVNREKVDIVLLDHDLGAEKGSTSLKDIRRSFNGPVLIVTGGMSDIDAVQALVNGCSGIFLKQNPLHKLFEAISIALHGETWLDPSVIKPLIQAATSKVKPVVAQPLNTRELDVLRAILEGLSNKEIANRLEVTESSIKWATHQIFRKTGVRKRSQLVRVAIERQLFAAGPGK